VTDTMMNYSAFSMNLVNGNLHDAVQFSDKNS
jgi:hypothetical protein